MQNACAPRAPGRAIKVNKGLILPPECLRPKLVIAMRFIPAAVHVTLIGIALFFALMLGSAGLWALNAPLYGIEDAGRSQAVIGLGRLFDLGTVGQMRIAAVTGAFKVGIGSIFALHLFDRARAIFGRSFDQESLEAALVLVTALTLILGLPALLAGNAVLIANHATILLLAGVAALLSTVERMAFEPSLPDPAPTEAAPNEHSSAQPR